MPPHVIKYLYKSGKYLSCIYIQFKQQGENNNMAGIKDVAKLAGVGVGTVSRVLNKSGYVSQPVIERVNQAMKELKYTPNFSARSLKTQKTNLIGLFVPTIYHPFFCAIAQQLVSLLDKEGYKLMLVCSQDSVEKENSVISLVAQNRMDGAVFFTHQKHDDISPEYPIVTMDRHLGEHIPCITSDNYKSSYSAVEYLISRGCKKVGYLGGRPGVESEVTYRVKAYLDVMHSRGMEERALFEEVAHGDEKSYAQKYFDMYGDVDGILVSGDLLALSYYTTAVNAGRKVPEDLKIISYDGVLFDWQPKPTFTSVKQNLEELAKAIVEQLVNKINGRPFEQKIIIPSSFALGETT